LFTDIEGSTALWEEDPDAMRSAIVRHDSILRTTVSAHGGYVFKMMGDACYAAFAVARDALDAAIDAQRALRVEQWPTSCELQVRMALHTGAAQDRDGDYVGPPLNRLARVLAAGHGGHILLTGAARSLVYETLRRDVHLRDLGYHRLKDLQQPERIYQVIAPDLPVVCPPLRTLEARPNNLPVQSTSFIGREAHVAAVRARVLDPAVRLLTLTGPGGVGKTRLVLQAAAELIEEFEDGVIYVPLDKVSDPAKVSFAIAEALGEASDVPGPVEEVVREHLSDRHILLVLDNFEQVADAAPEVAGLIAAAPHLKVLVTSRMLLHLSCEHSYVVPPLTLAPEAGTTAVESLSRFEAVRLFVERAQAASPDFVLNESNAAHVGELCRRLDGQPLAIELAAARTKLLSPQAMIERMSDPFALLAGGPRDQPRRQRTLLNTLEWSYNLLTPEEQELFPRLAAFVGGHTLEAAETVCSRPGLDVLTSLAGLVDASLVIRSESDGETRFTMLQTVREYALSLLRATAHPEDLYARHALYYMELAQRVQPGLRGPNRRTAVVALDRERDNFTAAVNRSIESGDPTTAVRLGWALWIYLWIRGHLDDGRRWMQAAIEFEDLSDELRAKALFVIGDMLFGQNEFDAAVPALRDSIRLFRRTEHAEGLALSLNVLGYIALYRHEYERAVAMLDESLAILRELGDAWAMTLALSGLGWVAVGRRQYDQAAELFEEAVRITRPVEDDGATAFGLSNLGAVALFRDDRVRAVESLEESVRLFRHQGERTMLTNALLGLARSLAASGGYERAAELYEETLTVSKDLNKRRDAAESLSGLGWARLCLGDLEAAHARFADSLPLSIASGHSAGAVRCLEGLAGLAVLAGDRARAARLAGAARAARDAQDLDTVPAERLLYERYLRPARQSWPEAEYEAGAQSTLEEAAHYALPDARLGTKTSSFGESLDEPKDSLAGRRRASQ